METGFLHLHNLVRWLILIAGLAAIIMYAMGLSNKKVFSKADDRIGLIFMICMDIQLLLGSYLYFAKGHFNNLMEHSSEVMKESILRFFSIEHGFGMMIALILVHLGRAATKKGDDQTRFRKGLIYFGIALLIILITIPWPFRQMEIARPWFPGMGL